MACPSTAKEATAAEPCRTERRAAPRYRHHLEGECQPVTANETGNRWPVDTLDVSTGGVSLQASRRFEPGTLLAVEFRHRLKPTTFVPLARVCRVARVDSHWLLGCAWLGTISADELHDLIGAAALWSAVRNRLRETGVALRQFMGAEPASATRRGAA